VDVRCRSRQARGFCVKTACSVEVVVWREVAMAAGYPVDTEAGALGAHDAAVYPGNLGIYGMIGRTRVL